MNSAFVGYEELSRSPRVLSTSAITPSSIGLILHILREPNLLIAKYSTCIIRTPRYYTDTFWGPLGDRQFGVPVVECNRKEGSIQK